MAGPASVAVASTSRREWAADRLGASAPFVLAAGASLLLAIDDGGYLATTWGWSALAFAWVGGVGLVLREGRVSRLEVGWIGGLTALTAWTAASMLWTSSQTESALEVERTFVYLLAAIAIVAVARSLAYRGLLWGAWAGSTAACLYGLATRLFPERIGATSPVAGNRLFDPIGYWNGLGLLAAIAAVLAAGLAAHSRPGWARALAAAVVPLLLPTLYFTFSRGAWLALAAAVLAALALSDRRLTLAFSFLLQALPAVAAVWLAVRSKPLHTLGTGPAAMAPAGHTLAWRLLLFVAAAGFLRASADSPPGRRPVPARIQRGFAVLLLAAVVAAAAGAVVHYGGPTAAFDRARRSIDSSPAVGSNLNQRLFSLSSDSRLHAWRVSLDQWRAHPLLGGGAGSFAGFWAAAGPAQPQLVEVHNLYLETLAELGPIGFALVAFTLLVPLAAAVRARRRSLVPIAGAAYVAWLVHVAYDWDWELPGVTIAAILCGGALLVAARRESALAPQAPARWGLFAIASVAGVAALLGLLGNRALARSADSLHSRNYPAAVAAAKDARRWQPWSSAPWAQLALVRRIQGDRRGERIAYERAVAEDPRNWQLWLGLLSVSHGAEYRNALARLSALSPAAATGVKEKP
jgi:O-Antigen ligase